DVEIEIAIAVGVEEGGAGVPARSFDAEAPGDVFEGPVAAIPIQDVGAEVGDEEVRPAVGVVIGDGDARPPLTLAADPRAVGRVLEPAVGETAVQRVPPALDDARAVETPAVHDVEIEPAVAVVVEESEARARRIEQVVLAGSPGQEDARHPGFGRHVDEPEAAAVPRPLLARAEKETCQETRNENAG